MMFKRLFIQTTRTLGLNVGRYRPEFQPGIVSLHPEGAPRGIVLLAYILEPFQRQLGNTVSTSHTHYRESVLIAEAWRKHGYSVDVIDYRNHEFIPQKRYDFFVSARTHLETIAARLSPDCVKIAHLDTSHYATNNYATYTRLLDLQHRRGLSLPGSARFVEPNLAIENAHYGVVLGNEVTAATYRYANKPLFTINVPAAVNIEFPLTKDFSAYRNYFLWFGSSGMVHKGLDLVLEAFAVMPEMHLTICGPVSAEKDFQKLYRKELYETANIRTVGWVDVSGSEFARIAQQCVGVVYPSCAEGQAGSVVTCLCAGLLPIVSRETGILVGDFGAVLENASVEEICRAVRTLASLPPTELAARATRVWEHAVSCHSQGSYLRDYGRIIHEIIADSARRTPTVD
jgi:glycosyltransferase involved in cell wall biosynthesis